MGLIGKLDMLPLFAPAEPEVADANRNNVATMRLEREMRMEDAVRILPDAGAE